MKIRRPSRPQRSRGAILPLTAIRSSGLCGFIAFSVDLGMLAVAAPRCRMRPTRPPIAGARSLNGSTGSNLADVDGQRHHAGDAKHDPGNERSLPPRSPSATAPIITITPPRRSTRCFRPARTRTTT